MLKKDHIIILCNVMQVFMWFYSSTKILPIDVLISSTESNQYDQSLERLKNQSMLIKYRLFVCQIFL